METVKYIPCLTCGELMQRRQYTHSGRSSGTIIDLCRGHGVWLDHEEIERILEFVANAPQQAPTSIDPSVFISSRRALGTFNMTEPRRSGYNPLHAFVEFLIQLVIWD